MKPPSVHRVHLHRVVPRFARVCAGLVLAIAVVATVAAPAQAVPTATGMRAAQAALERETGARVTVDRGTGAARSMRFAAGRGPKGPAGSTPAATADGFVSRHAAAFGVGEASRELSVGEGRTDALGMTHRRYRQQVDGVEVYGGVLDVHVGRSGEVRSANGRIVPGIAVDTRARVDGARAGRIAVEAVLSEPPGSGEKGGSPAVVGPALEAWGSKLWVYDDGMVRGRRGTAHLAWLVEVRGPGVREFVFVDAHAGKVVERWSGVHDTLFRRLYQGSTSTQVWAEGNAFPGALNEDQQNILVATEDAYRFFANAFGRDSWDGLGSEFRSVNDDPSISCPNANWNGTTTNYCSGVTSDDVVAHEWAHAYTGNTSDLIYLWQSGALNESYSDIWGETVDLLNGYGTDAPAPERSDGICSSYLSAGAPVDVVVSSPAGIAGTYLGGAAAFGPRFDTTGITAVVVAALDGTAPTGDACEAVAAPAQVAGRIAFVDRGNCNFAVKVKNAQNAGAVAVIVADNDPSAAEGSGMSGTDATITIPSVRVSKAAGDLLRGALASSPVATLRAEPRDNSVRWLMGEDASGFGGAIRDMWNPACANDPGRVGDARYYCGSADGGGVHTNSGVPNHGYALLVDGGTFEGHVIPAIGLVKAAHVHWRAQSEYLQPVSEFPDHADALEASCADLVGVPLAGLGTGASPPGPSGETITQADCDAVAVMAEALDLRADIQSVCSFSPLLAPDPPARCADNGATPVEIWSEGFEAGAAGWTTSSSGVFQGWPGITWSVSSSLPDGRTGKAAFAADPRGGSCDSGAGDFSGVQVFTSAPIAIPAWIVMAPRLDFDHYVATESGWDGGNLKISVNGGAYSLVPSSAFRFNAYNSTLRSASGSPANTNPLAGQSAFTGTDGGSLGGSWGRSQVDLSAVGVKPGDVVRLR
ncbi:M4 family metallopeptidase, partial [bacterium]|nr:M4 family metallopeptidase [bacterium]